MKKTFSLILALLMCLSFSSCNNKIELTEQEIREALSECEGTLTCKTSGNKVTEFTYVVETSRADKFSDKNKTISMIERMLSGNIAKVYIDDIKDFSAIMPLVKIDALFVHTKLSNDENIRNAEAFEYLMILLPIICDGETAKYDGWTVSAKVDQDNYTITYSVKSK
ncbi:MAG: hypothetical protein J6D42_11955 [Clostridia bacterium]|nr:hypothetical protein [Clostridia bacterium]